MKKARDVMSENPSCGLTTDTVRDAVQIMERNDCGVVPVVDTQGKAVGIVTDRDICLFLGLSSGAINPAVIPLTEVMTEDPLCCHPSDSLSLVVKMMEENQVRRLLVVDSRGLVTGIISQGDVALEDEDREEVCEMLMEISR